MVYMDQRFHPDAPTAHVRVISCDECVMRCTARCGECVVNFVLQADHVEGTLELDQAEYRAVRLLATAGMIPALQYRLAG
jgi:hypothetical protein